MRVSLIIVIDLGVIDCTNRCSMVFAGIGAWTGRVLYRPID